MVDLIERIEKEAKKFFSKASPCHDWSHVERVRKLALKIAKKEKADLKIVEIAALLHDIARAQELRCKGNFCHAKQGAKLARDILKKIGLSSEEIGKISHAIESHRFRKSGSPKTIEAKVIFDADKLDSIGAVGIGRAFLFAGCVGSKKMYTGREKELSRVSKDFTHHKDDSAVLEYEKILKYKKDKMYTETGKKIALDRHRVMEKFFSRFWKEVEGKK